MLSVKKSNASFNQKNRLLSLDILRTIAILCVIITHVSEACFPYSNALISSVSIRLRLAALLLHLIGRCGVPVFFFLTGYLVLTKSFLSTEDILRFWKNHLLPLVITSSIWGLIYYVYGIVADGQSISIGRLIRELLFYQKYEGSQFWYIPVIIGIYIFLPYVSIILQKTDNKILFRIFIFAFLYSFVPPMLNPMLTSLGVDFNLNPMLDLSWSGRAYGLLTLAGYWMAKDRIRIKRVYCPVIIVVSLFFLLIEENFCYLHGNALDVWYDNIILIILCLAIFEFFLPVKKSPLKKAFTWISRNAFGIFLVHNLFVKLFTNMLSLVYWKKFIVLFLLVMGFSLFTVWILGINKKISRLMLYKK